MLYWLFDIQGRLDASHTVFHTAVILSLDAMVHCLGDSDPFSLRSTYIIYTAK